MSQELNATNFEDQVLKSGQPALVDFFAPWCGPCKMMGPVIDELSNDNQSKKVTIAKVNVDDNQELASKYGVMSIPTLILFDKTGQIKETLTGVQSKESLQEKIDQLQ